MDTGFWAGLFAWLFGQEDKDSEDTEEFRCETCDRRISEEEYYEHGGLCRRCRGAPTQRGFTSPSEFPKI